MEVVQLSKQDHMLGGEIKTGYHLVENQTYYDFLVAEKVFEKDSVRVFVNDEPVNLEYIRSNYVKNDDRLSVVVVQKDPITAFFVYLGASQFVAAILTSFVVNLLITAALQVVFGRDSQNSGGGDSNRRQDPDAYSITGGGNEARRYAPIPLVIGKRRVFPDVSSPWWTDYITDPTSARPVCNSTPNYATLTLPVFALQPETPTKAWQTFTAAEQDPGPGWTRIGTGWGSAENAEYLWTYGVGTGICGGDVQFYYRWVSPTFGQPWTAGVITWTTGAEYVAATSGCGGDSGGGSSGGGGDFGIDSSTGDNDTADSGTDDATGDTGDTGADASGAGESDGDSGEGSV